MEKVLCQAWKGVTIAAGRQVGIGEQHYWLTIVCPDSATPGRGSLVSEGNLLVTADMVLTRMNRRVGEALADVTANCPGGR